MNLKADSEPDIIISVDVMWFLIVRLTMHSTTDSVCCALLVVGRSEVLRALSAPKDIPYKKQTIELQI